MQRSYKAILIGNGTMGKRHRGRFENSGVAFSLVLDTEATQWISSNEAEKFLAERRPSFVVIASPACTHYEYAKFFLTRGIAVFVEKPLAISGADAFELIHLAEQMGTTLFVAQSECFNPLFLTFRKHFMAELRNAVGLASENSSPLQKSSTLPLPNPLSLHLEFCREHGYTKRCRDVGVALDILVHDLSLFLTMFRYEDVKVVNYKQSNDKAEMVLQLADGPYAGVTANFIADRNSPRDVRTISVDYGQTSSYTISLATYTSEGDLAHIPDSLENEHRFFLKLLAGACGDWGKRLARTAAQTVKLANGDG